jgi:hypothetical protein
VEISNSKPPVGGPEAMHHQLETHDGPTARRTDDLSTLFGPDDRDTKEVRARAVPRYSRTGMRAPHDHPEGLRQRLEVLRYLVSEGEALEPWPDADALGGHAWRGVDEILGLPLGGGRDVLEELADFGLLERELFNRIHLCPSCSSCRLNFRETCPACESIALQTEGLIHHFACAHGGLESEFRSGRDLVCPKCKEVLVRLGEDFERPHQTYVCRKGNHLFEDPRIEGQCLDCDHVAEAGDLIVRDVHGYRATESAHKALELGRLSRLEVGSLAYHGQLRLATREHLEREVGREIDGIRVRGHSFMTLSLRFEVEGRPYPVLSEWSEEAVDELTRLLLSCLSGVDLVVRVDPGGLGVLLVGGDEMRFEVVEKRLRQSLTGQDCLTTDGDRLEVAWKSSIWSAPGTHVHQVMSDLGVE